MAKVFFETGLEICRCDPRVELLVGLCVRSFTMLVKSIADVEEDSMKAQIEVKHLQILYKVSAVQSSASQTDEARKLQDSVVSLLVTTKESRP